MKLARFRVTNYRSIRDSGWVEVEAITAFVGQNEAGKSNLFEALYRLNPFAPDEAYDIDEDWPVDDWGNKDPTACVCEAEFTLSPEELESLRVELGLAEQESPPTLVLTRSYSDEPRIALVGSPTEQVDASRLEIWARQHLPRLVLIQEYGFSGTQIDLDQLTTRLRQVKWHQLSNEEQTASTILDLARFDIDNFTAKGSTAKGRTERFVDKRAAASYLSKQFRDLWSQKAVNFHIEIDGSSLNIFAEDDAVGMPVPLHRRSAGFRWHAAFAWKFTQASEGLYRNCILLLEEPGIHLHYAGQRDLLEVFERLSASNTVLYTTHLSSMIDPAYPERLCIVETHESRTTVRNGVVSSQRTPTAIVELALGLNGDMGELLATRQTLIVESGVAALILQKLSGILGSVSKPHLSDRVYLWPAHGAHNLPLHAAYAVGRGLDAAVLLNSGRDGEALRSRIDALAAAGRTEGSHPGLRVLMLGEAAGIQNADAAVEDLFDTAFYLDCVNSAFGLAIREGDLPAGTDRIALRVEEVLVTRYAHTALDRRRLMKEILLRMDTWEKLSDLPRGTASRAEKLFMAINAVFNHRQNSGVRSIASG